MDIKNVTSVNAKYIFFKEDGKEDRKPSHYAELQQMMDNLQADYYFYNRMLTETRTLAEKHREELDKLDAVIEDLKSRIEAQKDIPEVKRGLADICFNLKSTEEKRHEKGLELCGIHKVSDDTLRKLERTETLIRQIKEAMRSCK